MKMINTLCSVIAAIGALSAAPAVAGGVALNATVVKVALRKGLGNILLVEVSVPPSNPPVCATSGWHFSLAMNHPIDDKIYATLLAALAAGTSVDLEGTGACTQLATVETLQDVYIHN